MTLWMSLKIVSTKLVSLTNSVVTLTERNLSYLSDLSLMTSSETIKLIWTYWCFLRTLLSKFGDHNTYWKEATSNLFILLRKMWKSILCVGCITNEKLFYFKKVKKHKGSVKYVWKIVQTYSQSIPYLLWLWTHDKVT